MQCFSNHIFMLPFSLKGCGDIRHISEQLQDKGWYRDGFQYTKGDFAANFSAQAYFYEFSIGALLDDGSKNCILETYTKRIGDNAQYRIKICASKHSEAKEYILHVEKLTLNIYDGKVAILAFHLENLLYEDFQDVLTINDVGRRIYPFYFNLDENGEVDLTEVKQNLLADRITLDLDSKEGVLEDDFNKYTVKNEHPFALPNYISGILPSCMHNVHWLQDDRMYVICWYGDDEISSHLNLTFSGSALETAYERKDETFDFYYQWYKFVYVYKTRSSCNTKTRFAQQLRTSTYDRWAEQGCLYGITRYSFVSLTDKSGYTRGRKYMRSMYYNMASLCLAQKTLLLYFSNEIADITSRLNTQTTDTSKLFEEVKKLNLDFIRFKNNIYFREVTTQTQGIELYSMMQSQMEIEEDGNEVQSEIAQLYQYVNMDGDQRRTSEAGLLNKFAAIFLPLTVVTGIFGMNNILEMLNFGTMGEIAIGAIFCLICYIGLINWTRRKL